jgi:hypothetical protein
MNEAINGSVQGWNEAMNGEFMGQQWGSIGSKLKHQTKWEWMIVNSTDGMGSLQLEYCTAVDVLYSIRRLYSTMDAFLGPFNGGADAACPCTARYTLLPVQLRVPITSTYRLRPSTMKYSTRTLTTTMSLKSFNVSFSCWHGVVYTVLVDFITVFLHSFIFFRRPSYKYTLMRFCSDARKPIPNEISLVA